MVIKGTAYENRETAGAALLEVCKEIKDMEPVVIGSYRGFTMSVPIVLRNARHRHVLELAERLPDSDYDEMEALVRRMSSALSAADRAVYA